MKKYKLIIIIAIAGFLTSCGEDYLTLYPSSDVVAGAPATQDVIEQNLTGAYQIMLFDAYASSLWMPVNGFFDICTDDIYIGGGSAEDQPYAQLTALFRPTPVTGPSGWWSIFFAGLKRCNGTLEAINNAVDVQPATLARLKAETLTLRAYYVHWLWKAYGNIPYFDKAWTGEPFIARQHSFNEIYPIIIADLEEAIKTPEFPMTTTGAATGRITKAMAMMTKARVVLYFKDQSKYGEILADMKTIIAHKDFSLITSVSGSNSGNTTNPVEWIFLREGEFSSESIFEVNHTSVGGNWGGWNGFGNYTCRFTGARTLPSDSDFDSGWGFCPVQREAYAIFEDGDYRKEASVIEFPDNYNNGGYQSTGLFLKKYIARKGYNDGTIGDPSFRWENNKRIYRIAEAYLNAAELEFYAGGQATAQPYLDAIRDRAFGNADHRIPATLNNIKLERRREFFGEGLRFWDLLRWGTDEKETPIATVLTRTDLSIPISRTWDDNKKFMPIPQGEIDKTKGTEFELTQNPGYDI